SRYRKQDRIASRVRRGVHFKHHECETSFLEAVFSRGDRALSPVIERAWRHGARFDGWSETFLRSARGERALSRVSGRAWRQGARFDGWTETFLRSAWVKAFAEEGIDPERYAHGD